MGVIQLSIPIFFLLIAVELFVSRRRKRRGYRLNDSISDLSLGIMSQITGVFVALVSLGIFMWVSDNWSLQRLIGVPQWPEGSPFTRGAGSLPAIAWPQLLSWLGVFVLVDLLYYWKHRWSHEINVLWAGHVVHHSSEEYNLAVALRQSSLDGLWSWMFYIPLAFIGIPIVMFAVCQGLNLIYQFWIHTREIERLGPLETVMNTPSHHRVHHAVNPQYLDRNYAGVFIIWDRIFGTFEPEVEEPVYGITKPLRSWNPVWANVHVLADILSDARHTRRWSDKIGVFVRHPGWRPADLGPSDVPQAVTPATFTKFDPPAPRAVMLYAFAQFVVVVIAAFEILRSASSLPVHHLGALGFYVILALSGIGGMLETRPWAVASEVARHGALAAAFLALAARDAASLPLLASAALFSIASVAWAMALRRHMAPSPAHLPATEPALPA